ncbi:MAG: flagellar biosynthesis anti-sigma factor FlgM [Gammaproteobacteria bacterium TMED50]|nr:MAG: flagellar biosynthesis anti-sigma factor FlgM [Gammaproteobacteria bacterium TMED50]|tara:strand:+ start:125 stop:418 length:294 start_codon:yes stop_codon:yes gene_type:complete
MVDEISNVGSSRTQQTNQTAKPKESTGDSAKSVVTEPTASRPPSVEVELSREIQRSEERAQFDEAKVRALKDQIEKGTYPIDTQKLAEKFADLEQLL